MRLWRWWHARSHRQIDPLPLSMVRVAVCAVLCFDLLWVARLGLVGTMWLPADLGGLAHPGPLAVVVELAPAWGGAVLWGVAVVGFALGASGVATRPAMLLALLAYAQLGHTEPFGDRAIDRLMRTTLLVLLLSGAHKRLSLGRWLRGIPPAAQIAAWPVDLLRFILVLVYLAAGLNKLGSTPGWVDWRAYAPMFRILSDPMAGRLSSVDWQGHEGLFYSLGLATVLLECSAVLILTRWMPWWAIGGLGMHLGIAALMRLGYFSWGMLALYPLLFSPWIRANQTRTG